MKYCVFCLTAIVVFFSGCTGRNVKISEPSQEEIQRIMPAGEQSATQLLKKLKGELLNAIRENGFEKAIEVCHTRAGFLTDSIEKSTENIIRIKRTTNQPRNKHNEPDEVEAFALNHFEEILSRKDTIPGFYIQKVTINDSVFYYYFKPLIAEALCLGCHGKPENIDAATAGTLKKLYPEDKATGYSEGDFRGLVSVIIPE